MCVCVCGLKVDGRRCQYSIEKTVDSHSVNDGRETGVLIRFVGLMVTCSLNTCLFHFIY